MSQHDMIIDNADGASVRADINAALQALASQSKGPSAPSTAYAGQPWLDDNTPSSSTWTWHVAYDGTDWISGGTVDTTNNRFVFNGLFNLGSAGSPGIAPAGDSDTGIWSAGANTLNASTGGVERLRLTSGGLFGFGTTPTYLFHVSNLRDDTVPARMVIQNTNASGGLADLMLRDDRGGTDLKRVSLRNAQGVLQIGHFNDAESAFTERARFETDGDLRLNATVPVVRSDERLSVGGVLGAFPAGTTNTPAIATKSPDDTFHISFVNAAGTEVGNITGGGGASVSYNTTSDYRLKRDTIPITAEQAEAAIRALNPLLGRYLSDPDASPLRPMYFAHEYQLVVPSAVYGERDGERMQSAQYDPMSPYFAAALAAALDRIAALEARVTALEA